MASDAGEHNGKEAPIYISESDEGSSKDKGQRLLKAKKFDSTDEKEELRLRILSRRESRQKRMKANQNKGFLRLSYLESDSDDEEEEEEGEISLAAIKAKYKALVRGKRSRIHPSNSDDVADKGRVQRPRKIRRIVSDDEEEENFKLKRKAEAEDRPIKKLKKREIQDEEDECGEEG